MTTQHDILRLFARTRPASVLDEFDRPPEDHGPAGPPLPYEVGFCRITANLGAGLYKVTELEYDDGWVLVTAGRGFIDHAAIEADGNDGGEVDDEPIPFLWARKKPGGRQLAIFTPKGSSMYYRARYPWFPGCGGLLWDRLGNLVGSYEGIDLNEWDFHPLPDSGLAEEPDAARITDIKAN